MTTGLDPRIKQLADAFDCEYPKHVLVVSGYHISGGQIFISEIKVFDSKGKFIKLADKEKVINHLHEYPIRFEKR